MAPADNNSFFKKWQKHTIIAIGITELIIVIVFLLTELGNVASNFWLTNVFAGSWCGLVALIHAIQLFVIAWCFPSAKAAGIALITTIIALLAYALLISFDGVFIAQPSTCILGTICTNQSVSTTIFSYNYSQSFFTAFNSLNGFKTYTLAQSKYLFQTVQISFGCLGFVLCLVYIAIYFMRRQETGTRVIPFNNDQDNRESPARPIPGKRNVSAADSFRKSTAQRSARVPQLPPGEVPWNPNKN